MNFIQLLANVCKDIWKIYVHFFRWNLGKILILCFSFFLAVLSFIPFFIIIIILWFIDSIPWGEILLSFATWTQIYELLSAFSTSPIMFIFEAFLVVLGIGIAIGVFNYKSVLLFRLSDALTEKTDYRWKDNFYLGLFKKYLQVFPRLFLILALPVGSFIVYFFCIVFLFWGFNPVAAMVQENPVNTVSILLLIGLIIWAGWFFYKIYRLAFSYIVLQDEKHRELTATEVIETGCWYTKGKIIFSIIAIVLLYGLFVTPLEQYGDYAAEKSAEMSQYSLYNNLAALPDEFDFASLNIGYDSKEDFINSIAYTNLFTQYGWYDIDALERQAQSLATQSRVVFIIHFLLFYGLFEVILLSIYKNRIHSHLHPIPEKKSFISQMKNKFFSQKKEL